MSGNSRRFLRTRGTRDGFVVPYVPDAAPEAAVDPLLIDYLRRELEKLSDTLTVLSKLQTQAGDAETSIEDLESAIAALDVRITALEAQSVPAVMTHRYVFMRPRNFAAVTNSADDAQAPVFRESIPAGAFKIASLEFRNNATNFGYGEADFQQLDKPDAATTCKVRVHFVSKSYNPAGTERVRLGLLTQFIPLTQDPLGLFECRQ